MKKNAWNWLNAIVLVLAAGMIANLGYLLLQGRDVERGDWGWLMVILVCLSVINLKNLWDDVVRSRNPADAPRLKTGQGPEEADSG